MSNTALVTFNGMAGNAIVTASGKTTGIRLHMNQGTEHVGLTAKEIKATLKARNPLLTGKELTEHTNKVIRGETDIRKAQSLVAFEGLWQGGYVCDVTEARKNTATMKFVKVTETSVEQLATARELLAKANGMTVEQMDKLFSSPAAKALVTLNV